MLESAEPAIKIVIAIFKNGAKAVSFRCITIDLHQGSIVYFRGR